MSRPLKSKTDWDRVRRESTQEAPIPYHPSDGPYDPNDPEAVNRFFATATGLRRGGRGPQKAPTKQKVTLRLTEEVVAHFRETGPGWQSRIDQVLLRAIKAKRGREVRRA
jgi:uncharacterized protein (DUF4415 family)